MMDVPFKLDSITNLPRYVVQNIYQTILGDDEQGVLWYPTGRFDLFIQHLTVWVENLPLYIPIYRSRGLEFLPLHWHPLLSLHR